MRISSPPTMNSCFYGIATPERDKLLASQMTIAEMGKYIGADSLAFISIDGLYRAVGEKKRNPNAPQFCDACFTGDYPIPLVDHEAGKVLTQLSLLTENV
jgi:amidophosphoribosyltransferase